jgi:hypothetical protein
MNREQMRQVCKVRTARRRNPGQVFQDKARWTRQKKQDRKDNTGRTRKEGLDMAHGARKKYNI